MGLTEWKPSMTSHLHSTRISPLAREPLKDFWFAVVKSVSEFGMVTGVVRLTQRKPRVEALDRLS